MHDDGQLVLKNGKIFLRSENKYSRSENEYLRTRRLAILDKENFVEGIGSKWEEKGSSI